MELAAPIRENELEHLVHEALSQLGWVSDAKRLAQRLARLHIGLPREDEFAVVCAWLGKCQLIHKLDQQAAPATASTQVQVPDLLASFRHEDRELTFLIEVKSKQGDRLSFKADYFRRLKRYGSLLQKPVLVAWKHYGIWTLFDIDLMRLAKTNYHIDLETALKENLLGVLAGDFSYMMSDQAGVHIRFRKDELCDEREEDGTVHQEWKTVVDDVHFTVKGGERRDHLSPRVQSLFFAQPLNETQEHSETHIHLHCTAEAGVGVFAHMALVALLTFQNSGSSRIDWRATLARPQPVPNAANYEECVQEALAAGVVSYIFLQQPEHRPPYLVATSQVSRAK